jgi:ligand-binding sensor domain-containing protein
MKELKIFVFVFIILTNILMSQSPEWLIFDKSNSIIETYHVKDIDIDINNNLWITTTTRDTWNTGGIVFTDRENWEIYNSKNSDLITDTLRNLVIDKQGYLWIATTDKGVIKFKEKTVENFDTLNSPLPWQKTLDIAVDSLNVKWFSNNIMGGGLISYDNGTWRVFDSNDVAFPSKGYVSSVFVDKNNDKWIGYYWDSYIFKYDGLNWTVFDTLAKWDRHGIISSFARDSLGNLWIGWDEPVKFTGTHWVIYLACPLGSINTIAVDTNNDIWFGSHNGMMKYDRSTWTVFDTTNSALPYPGVNKIVIDKYGNKWIVALSVAVYKEGGVIGITDVEDDKKVEQNKILCYPNPSSGITKIRYRIESPGIISLLLTDALGNRKILKSEYKYPGDYIEEFDLSAYSQGLYNIILQQDNKIYSGKIALIK